ncbi:type II secretion system F family protein [Marinobacteraceae bacterium S3BR75-40.1]
MQFSYRGRDNSGALHQGALEAPNRDAAAAELQRRGIIPLSVEEHVEKADVGAKLQQLSFFRPKVQLDDLIVFARQMSALSKAGIPIIRTMRGLADTTRSPALGEVLDDLATRLEGGTTLATAMQAHRTIFSDMFVAMIHVGENTGQLDEAFFRMAQILELERDTKRRIKQATRYPTFVIVALLAALLIVNFFVIPKFASVFSKLGADLPFLTQVLVATSDFLINYWPFLLVAVVGAIYAFKSWKKTEEGRLVWDRHKLRFPIVGGLFELITLSRFSRNFATVLKSGMPVTHALTVVADAVDNAWIAKHIREMRVSIERGDSLLRASRQSNMFTPLVLQMIAVGEETGNVDEMLSHVADFYDEEVDYGLKRLAESIEPILIVSMGILVLILALGVFLPIWDLGRAALGK